MLRTLIPFLEQFIEFVHQFINFFGVGLMLYVFKDLL